jgi:hypothetical protein
MILEGPMKLINEETISRAYYLIKPLLSRRVQIAIRGMVARQKRKLYREIWPIDRSAGGLPPDFTGWPEGKRFSVVLTHDVDTARGVGRTEQLMELERELGFRSSFNFVARGYHLPEELRSLLVKNGFEIGVHGLVHDRSLYESASSFAEQAKGINGYLEEWGAVGFRSPCVYHNFEWLHGLNISYDASSFDTDPFEPQSDGVGTIFPILQKGILPDKGYVELPYTLPQDFTLYILFGERDIRVWKQKLNWIAEHGGMMLVNTHPDYMCFDGRPGFDEYPVDLYRDLLMHLQAEYRGEYWHRLPHEMATYWNATVSGVATAAAAASVSGIAPAIGGAPVIGLAPVPVGAPVIGGAAISDVVPLSDVAAVAGAAENLLAAEGGAGAGVPPLAGPLMEKPKL